MKDLKKKYLPVKQCVRLLRAVFQELFRYTDGNITTLIAAAVLYFMGTGTIKGFAITLMIGIVLSMFTAIVITRLIIMGIIGLALTSRRILQLKKLKQIIKGGKRK